jgi:hypothetical protein
MATWLNAEREVVSESFHLTRSRDPEAQPLSPDTLLSSAEALVDGRYKLTLTSDRFLHGVRLAAKGFLPDDNYFHLPPSRPKTVVFAPIAGHRGPLRASVEALNFVGEISLEARQPSL